jgi:hypothetical protein
MMDGAGNEVVIRMTDGSRATARYNRATGKWSLEGHADVPAFAKVRDLVAHLTKQGMARPSGKSKFEQLQVGDAFRFEGKIYVVNSNAGEVNALLASDKRDSEKAMMLAGYLYKRWLSYEGKANASRPGKSAFSLAAVKSAAAKVAAAYGTGEDSAVIRKHLDRIVSVLSGNTEGGRREAMGIHAQIGSVAERTHGRDFMWSAPMQGLESAIRSAGQFARPGAKARFYTPPVKTGKNGPVTWDNLFVGHLGNGWTLANRGHEVNGDYERVAHIAYGGEVTFAPGFNQARLDPRVKAYIHKLSVEAAQKKSAGEPLARTGSGQGIYSRARFANWETNLTKKYGKPIEEHTAKIGRNSWKIEVAEAMDGSVVANLYLWNDNRGFEHFESGSLQGLRSLAERTSRSDAASIAKINRIANYARPGAKAKFAATPNKVTYTDKSGVTHTYMVSDRILLAMNGTKKYAEAVGSKPDYASVLRLGERTGEVVRASRPGAKSMHAADNMYYTVAAHIGGQPSGERTTKSLDEAKAYAKAMLAALKPSAKGKDLVVDVYPVVNYSPQASILSLKASRPGSKSNGLTLAQRIAVAHDAKRMALR